MASTSTVVAKPAKPPIKISTKIKTKPKKQKTGPAPALRKGIKIPTNIAVWGQEPKTIFKPTDNYYNRPNGISIDTIILHCTVSKTSTSVINTFRKNNGNSVHIIIPDKGHPGNSEVSVRMVPDNYKAAHTNNGVLFDGKPNIDSHALGIEIVNMGTLEDPYSEWQIQETIKWCRYWVGKYKIKYIITHAYLQPNRRDPCVTFPWKKFVELVLKEENHAHRDNRR